MIVLLILAAIVFAIYCTKLEMDYRAEMDNRIFYLDKLCLYKAHWEGVPGYQTELIVRHLHIGPHTWETVAVIPFIQHYQAMTHSRQVLEECYKNSWKRHQRKKLQERARVHDDVYKNAAHRTHAKVQQSIEALNKSSQAGGHDY